MIFHIQRFSLHDGAGLRTTVFFKGCPLSCSWCSNPESQSGARELLYDPAHCIGCGDCARIDPEGAMRPEGDRMRFYPERQSGPERYRGLCPTRALQVLGEEKTAGEICREALKDKPFFGSSGGVTLSGGEPLMQEALCREVAERLKAQAVPLAIETCLHVPWENIASLLPYTGEFLCDFKHISPEVFRRRTGGDLALVLDNLEGLIRSGTPLRIRIPVIEGFNHDGRTIPAMLEWLEKRGTVAAVDFLPYHPLGEGKYRNLGRPYPHPSRGMTDEDIRPYIALAQDRNRNVTIGG